MGFSPLGLAIGLAVLAPNLLLVWFPPRTPLPQADIPLPQADIPRWLTSLERAGQSLCLVVPAITLPGRVAWWWLVPVVAALMSYYALWGRYLLRGRPAEALYRPAFSVPVPMAVLPVLVFLAAAGWLGNPWLAVAATVLAVGHIPASMRIAGSVGPGSR